MGKAIDQPGNQRGRGIQLRTRGGAFFKIAGKSNVDRVRKIGFIGCNHLIQRLRLCNVSLSVNHKIIKQTGPLLLMLLYKQGKRRVGRRAGVVDDNVLNLIWCALAITLRVSRQGIDAIDHARLSTLR